ncbi:MAG: hypothetical protein Q9226_005964 [Calogaya cf. arnoldii]
MDISKDGVTDVNVSYSAEHPQHAQVANGTPNPESLPGIPESVAANEVRDTAVQHSDTETVEKHGTTGDTSGQFPNHTKPSPILKTEGLKVLTEIERAETNLQTGGLETSANTMTSCSVGEAMEKVTGYAEYLKKMEARVAFLETKIQLPLPEKVKEPAKSEGRVPAIPSINRVKWTDFMNRVKDDGVHAIDVLVGDEQNWYQRDKMGKADVREEPKPRDSQLPKTVAYTAEREAPRRIRINSIPVIKILGEIIGAPSNTPWTLEASVFIQPFKPFILYENEFRGHLARLEEKWAQHDQDSVAGPLHNDLTLSSVASMDREARLDAALVEGVTDGFAKPQAERERTLQEEDLSDSLEALRDLRCLVHFMDEDLLPTIPNFQDQSRKQVLFKDLWHLLKPGQEVFIPRNDVKPDNDTSEPTRHRQREATQNRTRGQRYQEYWKIMTCGSGRVNIHRPQNDDDDTTVAKHIPNSFDVVAFHLDFVGDTYFAVPHSFTIRPFDGKRDITSLEVFPSSYLKDTRERRSHQITQGTKFRELTDVKHMRYRGMTFACQPCGCSLNGERILINRERIESNVMVDFTEALHDDRSWAYRLHTNQRSCNYWREFDDETSVKTWTDKTRRELHESKDDIYYNEEIDERDRAQNLASVHPLLGDDPEKRYTDGSAFRDEDLILLPNRVLAFAFRNRKFVALDINSLEEIVTYKKGWDDLKLPPGHKDMLKCLVGTHLRYRELQPAQEHDHKHDHDLVRGKGDLGLTADSVEKALEVKFHLAQVWDCILLLDEADVFLAERSDRDIKRNSLVSGMYHPSDNELGMQPTNRVAGFDEAFKSRIHLPLYFPPLKRKQTLAIWEINLKRTLERKNGMMQANKNEIMAFAETHFAEGRKQETNWNGRQIRNAFQTAAALAEFDGQKHQEKHQEKHQGSQNRGPVYSRLHTNHFKVVAKAAEQFDKYIQSVDGSTTLARNLHKGARNDAFRAEEIKISPPEADLIRSPTSVRSHEVRRNLDYVDEEELEAPGRAAHNSAFDNYSGGDMSISHSNSTQRRRSQQNRPQPHEAAPNPRSRPTYSQGYPTPDSSNSAKPLRVSQGDDFHLARPMGEEVKRRGPAPQRPFATQVHNHARHPEPEPDSDEPDYSGVDSEDEQ